MNCLNSSKRFSNASFLLGYFAKDGFDVINNVGFSLELELEIDPDSATCPPACCSCFAVSDDDMYCSNSSLSFETGVLVMVFFIP